MDETASGGRVRWRESTFLPCLLHYLLRILIYSVLVPYPFLILLVNFNYVLFTISQFLIFFGGDASRAVLRLLGARAFSKCINFDMPSTLRSSFWLPSCGCGARTVLCIMPSSTSFELKCP